MNKVIYLTLMWLLFAPVTAFAQMVQETYYSQMWIDDSEADPADQSPGRIYIVGSATTNDPANPFNHSYRTTASLWGTNGQSSFGDGGTSLFWDGVESSFSLNGTHITTCPNVCGCEWENYSGTSCGAIPLG